MKKNEKRQQTKGYFATVNGVKVNGKTYSEFTINYLTELVNQNKNLDFTDRLYAYIDYFVKNFSYDNDLRDRVLSRMIDETTEIKEESLFNLLHDGRGVCDQLAQAFSMLGSIDSELWQHGIVIEYSTCNISVKGKKMGHAVNHIVVGGNRFVVDLSTMIHCKQKDYQADEELFKYPSISGSQNTFTVPTYEHESEYDSLTMLFFSGYLTVKEGSEYHILDLDFPNEEAKNAFKVFIRKE